MSFSLFNQDTDLKEGPSPYPTSKIPSQKPGITPVKPATNRGVAIFISFRVAKPP